MPTKKKKPTKKSVKRAPALPSYNGRDVFRPKEPAVLLARMTKRPKTMAWFPENWVIICHQGESTTGWSLGPASVKDALAFEYGKNDPIAKPVVGRIEMLAEDWYASYNDVRGVGWEFVLVFPKARRVFSFEP